jgi:hypothetical protein
VAHADEVGCVTSTELQLLSQLCQSAFEGFAVDIQRAIQISTCTLELIHCTCGTLPQHEIFHKVNVSSVDIE